MKKIFYKLDSLFSPRPLFRECWHNKHAACPGTNEYIHQPRCECDCHYEKVTRRKTIKVTPHGKVIKEKTQ